VRHATLSDVSKMLQWNPTMVSMRFGSNADKIAALAEEFLVLLKIYGSSADGLIHTVSCHTQQQTAVATVRHNAEVRAMYPSFANRF
jgi:hypothetical protein